MAVTHFKITRAPSKWVDAKMGAAALQVGTLYPISEEANMNFSRIPSLDGFYLSDSFEYQAYDEVLAKYGNKAEVKLVWEENDLTIPAVSANDAAKLLHGQTVNLLAVLPISKSTEFVEIVSTSGAINLLKNGTIVLPGERLEPKDLLETKIIVLEQGGGSPYFQLAYKVGREGVAAETIYTYDVNVDSFAGIALGSQTSVNTIVADENGFEQEFIDETIYLEISGGSGLGTAQLRFNVNSPFLAASAENSVSIEINGMEYVKTANEIFDLEALLMKTGKASIKIKNTILNEAPGTYTGSVQVTLLSINNDPALVSQENYIVTVNSNF